MNRWFVERKPQASMMTMWKARTEHLNIQTEMRQHASYYIITTATMLNLHFIEVAK